MIHCQEKSSSRCARRLNLKRRHSWEIKVAPFFFFSFFFLKEPLSAVWATPLVTAILSYQRHHHRLSPAAVEWATFLGDNTGLRSRRRAHGSWIKFQKSDGQTIWSWSGAGGRGGEKKWVGRDHSKQWSRCLVDFAKQNQRVGGARFAVWLRVWHQPLSASRCVFMFLSACSLPGGFGRNMERIVTREFPNCTNV